jgi:hypothetical protein
MPPSTREDVILQLDRVDTALETPDADPAAILRDAVDWLAEHPPRVAADALYYRERLEVIRQRHGAA